MTLPYYLRLLCLCFATFFVVQAVVWLVVKSVAPAALKMAGTVRPRLSSRLLFALRIAPSAATLFIVIGFCVPSYVWLEPDIANERVGFSCLLAAVLGLSVWAISLVRGISSVVRTSRYLHTCRSHGSETILEQGASEALVVHDDAAVMAVAGAWNPRLVVSQSVMDALSQEQKDAAFRHEAAHRVSHDNLKKLLFVLSPDVLPFVSGLSSVEQGWAKFTEWAADDEAVSGNQERALSLASALVRVAKLGVRPAPAYLLSSLVDDDRDLETRVDRLLRELGYAEKPLQPLAAFIRNASLIAGGLAITMLLWPESLGSVHRLLEHLVQ
jgi:Zn-dependent protease with chaperone function